VVLVRVTNQNCIHGKVREIYACAIGIEGKSGVEKDAGFSG
jgi:hypothetical protein